MASEKVEPEPKRVKIAGPVVVDSNECINFQLLKKVDGTVALVENGNFVPLMSHQLFEEEQIRGFEDLNINIYFTPAFQALIAIDFEGSPAPGATDLAAPLKEAFSAGFFQDKDDFDAALSAEPPLRTAVMGTLLISEETVEDTKFQVYHSNIAAGSELVRALHARLQPLLLFFVDAASPISAEDPAWDLLLAVETGKDGAVEILGFATLYRFWVFPDRQRVRLSQVLVLPPHAGRGVGSLVLEAAYKIADEAAAMDITLEDPTEAMQRLRDRMDLKRMVEAEWPREEAQARLLAVLQDKGKEAAGSSAAAALSPLSAPPQLLERLQKELRMSRQQARHMWEAILYAVAVPQGAPSTSAVEGFVQVSLEAQVAGAKSGSEHKAVFDTQSGFVMVKSKRAGAPPPGQVPVEEASAEQQREAIRAAVAQRVEDLRRLVCGAEGDEEDDEGGDGEE